MHQYMRPRFTVARQPLMPTAAFLSPWRILAVESWSEIVWDIRVGLQCKGRCSGPDGRQSPAGEWGRGRQGSSTASGLRHKPWPDRRHWKGEGAGALWAWPSGARTPGRSSQGRGNARTQSHATGEPPQHHGFRLPREDGGKGPGAYRLYEARSHPKGFEPAGVVVTHLGRGADATTSSAAAIFRARNTGKDILLPMKHAAYDELNECARSPLVPILPVAESQLVI